MNLGKCATVNHFFPIQEDKSTQDLILRKCIYNKSNVFLLLKQATRVPEFIKIIKQGVD